ncbi:MAG: potassium channel protein [Gemmatimonadota bacterium]|nr:MAG: potassium channel protein [Gemmatimonadota bacterium]
MRDSGRPSTGARETAARSHIGPRAVTLGEALRPFRQRFMWAGVYFLIVFLIGTVGYHFIEEWGWPEALYMSVTTVTSVGFMEVYPLSPEGRYFTMGLIILGITGLGIWWALTTALIVELDLGGVLRRRRTMREIDKLIDHYLVCGVGRMGRVVVGELAEAGFPFVVVESNPARIALVEETYPEILVIEGDATREGTLLAARVQKAKGLAACLADDADNLLVCLTARHLNPLLNTVARAYNEESLEKLRRAGAEHVVSPNVTGGIRMAYSLLRPHVVSFLDCVISDAGIELRLEQATIQPGSPLIGQSLAEARIPQRTGLIVLGLRRAGQVGLPIYNPGPETQLESGDVMIVLGRSEQVEALRRYAGGEVQL